MAAVKTKSSSPDPGSRTEGPTIHDDFYRNLRAKITDWANAKDIDASYRDYILLLPDMFHFLTRLIMEPRVALRDKAWVGIAVAYVLSPIDFIPDALFPLGLVDDLIIMVIVLDSVLGNVPRDFIKKHWAGSGDLFETVRQALAKADHWVGKGVFQRIKTYLKKQGVWSETVGPVAPPPVPATAAPSTARAATAPKEPKAAKAAKKTPSRRPAAKTPATSKAAMPKSAKPKTAKPKTAKPASEKAASEAAPKTASPKLGAKRTIAPKKAPKGPSSS